MSGIDGILEKMGFTYDKLNTVERETFNKWLGALSNQTLTIDKVKEYVATMRASVEQDLALHDNSRDKDLFLKARLRNYLLLEAMLEAPDKAKKMFEAQLSNLAK